MFFSLILEKKRISHQRHVFIVIISNLDKHVVPIPLPYPLLKKQVAFYSMYTCGKRLQLITFDGLIKNNRSKIHLCMAHMPNSILMQMRASLDSARIDIIINYQSIQYPAKP